MIVLPTTFMNKQALIFKHVPIGIEISKPSRCQKSTVEWKTCINEAIQTKKKLLPNSWTEARDLTLEPRTSLHNVECKLYICVNIAWIEFF